MKEMKHYVTGIGDVLWDCFPEGRKIGGAPANFAYYMRQFGFDSILVSGIGNDELGEEIKEVLNKKELEHFLEISDYPTGTVMIELDDKGIPSYRIIENVAYDHIRYTSELDRIARASNVACFGSMTQRSPVTRNTIRRFLETMPQTEETYKVFDINLRQNFYDKEIISESLRLCNVFKINDEEFDIVCEMYGYEGLSDMEACRKIISDWNLKYLILTCGTNGSYIFTESEESYMDTPEVEVADTVGAGDSFIATFMASILKGSSIREAHELAVKVSAYVCTQFGGMCDITACL